MRQIYSKDLISEELKYEYKKAKGGLPKSFWESYSAFANSSGGYIYLGIEETEKRKYTAAGLTEDDIKELKTQLFNLCNNKEKISVNLLTDNDVEEVKVDDSYALIVRINKCPIELKPVFVNSNLYQGTYRRNADGDYHCSTEEVNAMIRNASPKSLDLEILEDHDINSLDLDSINQYRNIFASLHPAHPFLRENNERFLEFIGAARLNKNMEYRATKAGLLMFGYSYRIVYEFSDFFLDYIEVSENSKDRWTNRIESTSGDWSGNIFAFFNKVVNQLSDDIKKPFQISGTQRLDDNDLAKAVREALCNTLCNADYYIPGGVTIKKYRDKIEFSNPGSLMMDADKMIRGGESLPRNKTLLKMFNLIGIGERSGSGIPLIFGTAKEYDLPIPSIEEEYKPDRSILTFYLEKSKNDETLTKLETEIVKYLENNGVCSAKEISEELNKNITTIKLNLYSLVDKQIVESSGTIKDKKYFIKK